MDASSGQVYDEDYFLRGEKTGKSLYSNYRWLPELTIPMVERIVEHCGIGLDERILDFGCARGYVVKALHHLGHAAYGYDISEWAVEHCDPDIRESVSNLWPPPRSIDWILAKDVLEHIELHNITHLLKQLADVARKGLFIVVPLAARIGGRYVVDDYELDVTHRLRWPLHQWADELFDVLDHTWEISARHRLPGVKDNYFKPGWEKANGFITCRRIVGG